MKEITYVIMGNLFQEYYLTIYKTMPPLLWKFAFAYEKDIFIDAFDWCAFSIQECSFQTIHTALDFSFENHATILWKISYARLHAQIHK